MVAGDVEEERRGGRRKRELPNRREVKWSRVGAASRTCHQGRRLLSKWPSKRRRTLLAFFGKEGVSRDAGRLAGQGAAGSVSVARLVVAKPARSGKETWLMLSIDRDNRMLSSRGRCGGCSITAHDIQPSPALE